MARENEAEVLEYLNGLRVEYGIGAPLAELPPDYFGDGSVSEHCPVAAALETRCGNASVELRRPDGQLEDVEFPDFVVQFTLDHDERRLMDKIHRS